MNIQHYGSCRSSADQNGASHKRRISSVNARVASSETDQIDHRKLAGGSVYSQIRAIYIALSSKSSAKPTPIPSYPIRICA